MAENEKDLITIMENIESIRIEGEHSIPLCPGKWAGE